MDFDFGDGESIVQSLTSKVMSVIDKLRTSPNKCMNRVINNPCDYSQCKDGEVFADSALPKDRERVKSETHENKSNQKTYPEQTELNISEHYGDVEVVCSDTPGKDTCSHDTCELKKSIFYKSRDLPASSESLNLSTSISVYVLDRSRAKRLHTALGFSESLRKVYLTNSTDSGDSSESSSRGILQLNSDKESSDEEPDNNTRELANSRSEKTDADSTRSKPNQCFDSCSSGILNKTGVIEKGSNLIRCHADISNSIDITNEGSDLNRYSSESDDELVNIRYDTHDTTSSSVESTSNISDSNESPFGTRSFTEEFKHDIDYLAKSAYRTSTPDSKTAASVENSKASREELSVSDKRESERRSRDSFLSMTDSLFLLPQKRFVHGLSPLCRVPVSMRENDPSSDVRENSSSSHMRVRRSLVFVSPSNSFFYSKARDEVVLTDFQETQTNSPSCDKTPERESYSEQILPKVIFRDETEEAVYYLITKYLENSR